MFASDSATRTQQAKSYDSSLKESIRVNFVRKVFSIVSVQLLLTAAFIFLSMNSKALQSFQRAHPGLVSLSFVVSLITSLALALSDSLSRKVPINYALLATFTFAESYLVSAYTSQFHPSLVCTAFVLTGAAVGVLALYAIYSKTEITYFGGLIGLLSMGMISLFFLGIFARFQLIHTLSLVGSSILFGLYFIYDIKAIMGKDHIKVSLDDYIRGAMHLYIDIIQIFMKILELLKKFQEKEEEDRRRKKK
jgi:FtsH-binding integral membrane protein